MNKRTSERLPETPQVKLEQINLALSQGAVNRVRLLINEDLTAPDIAHLLSSVPPKQRNVV